MIMMNKMMLMILMMMIFSSNNWISLWLNSEMFNLLMILNMSKNKFNNDMELMMKFFIFHSLSASIMMIMIMKMNSSSMMLLIKMNIITIMLLMKISIIPFHWLSMMMVNLNSWINFFTINYIMKIPSLVMMNNLINSKIMIMLTIMIVIPFSSWNLTNMKSNMLFLSMNNMYWFLMIMMFNNMMWMIYILLYLTIMYKMVMIMNYFKINLVNQLMNLNYKNKMNMIITLMNMMNLPPMSLFLIKWITISIIKTTPILLMIMIITNIMMMFVYFKIITMMFCNKFMNNKWMTKNMKKKTNHLNLMTMLIML